MQVAISYPLYLRYQGGGGYIPGSADRATARTRPAHGTEHMIEKKEYINSAVLFKRVRLKDIPSIRTTLVKVAKEVLQGRMDPQLARAFGYMARLIMDAHRLEADLVEIETLMQRTRLLCEHFGVEGPKPAAKMPPIELMPK